MTPKVSSFFFARTVARESSFEFVQVNSVVFIFIKSLDDLGDLANDELIEIVGKDNLSEKLANEIIMSARAHWFEDEVVSQETFKDTEIEENIKTSRVK